MGPSQFFVLGKNVLEQLLPCHFSVWPQIVLLSPLFCYNMFCNVL